MAWKRGVHLIAIDKLDDNLLKHDNGIINKQHRHDINIMKEILLSGKLLPPIKVTRKGKRTEGFKRWYAHKELGFTHIPCQIGRRRPWQSTEVYKGKEVVENWQEWTSNAETEKR